MPKPLSELGNQLAFIGYLVSANSWEHALFCCCLLAIRLAEALLGVWKSAVAGPELRVLTTRFVHGVFAPAYLSLSANGAPSGM